MRFLKNKMQLQRKKYRKYSATLKNGAARHLAFRNRVAFTKQLMYFKKLWQIALKKGGIPWPTKASKFKQIGWGLNSQNTLKNNNRAEKAYFRFLLKRRLKSRLSGYES